jgi:hypothetical protein
MSTTPADGSRMQLDHVAVFHQVLAPDLLPIEAGRAPDPRVPERAG